MKVRTSELSGAALNWAAAIADGKKPRLQRNDDGSLFPQPVYDEYVWQLDYLAWNRGGPIIEREHISLTDPHGDTAFPDQWAAYKRHIGTETRGPTPLVAAMRCFVASKIGAEVEVPDELA